VGFLFEFPKFCVQTPHWTIAKPWRPGLSYHEAAKMCGCPTGTMKSRVNRARLELAQLLSIEGPEDFDEDPIINAAIMGGDRLAREA